MSNPLFSSPTRFSMGTRTSSRKTSFTSCPPSIVMIGRTVMPFDFMSIRRNVIPSCCLTEGSVRTRQNIQSAYCARVVHVLAPLTT